MVSEQISLRISKDSKEKLELLAKSTGRSKNFLAQDAIDKYLELESWQISSIQEGLEDIDNGQFVSIDEVKKEWDIK